MLVLKTAEALIGFNDLRALEVLSTALQKEELPGIQHKIIDALATFGHSAIDALSAALNECDIFVSDHIEEVLDKIKSS